ncbi:MAG: PQQ-binding-like beta-propeller repeat protein, partial [Maricaulaceae bacterium]
MRAPTRFAFVLVTVAALLATSCASRVNPFGRGGDDEDEANAPDRERRETILAFEDQLEVDPDRAGAAIMLPPASVNADWPNEGGVDSHAPGHPAAATSLDRAWRRNVGAGSSRRARVASPPVIGDGKVFAVDGRGEVHAYAASDGDRIWSTRFRSGERRDREFRSGGVAYGEGRLFVALGFGAVVALDAETGDEIWRAETVGPMHASPTVSNGRVFAVSFDGELYAFDADDGTVLWTYQSLSEPARILTSSSPAVVNDIVYAPFSSGELAALRADNGTLLWADALTRSGQLNSLSELNDIAGSPVVADGIAYAMSHSGILAAFDVRTGLRIWNEPAGGIHMPWVAGDYLFVMTNDAQLACISRLDGATLWLSDLPQYRNPNRRRGRIAWAGPVLAGGRLLLVSSTGDMISVSPESGEILDELRIGQDVFIPPIVANE